MALFAKHDHVIATATVQGMNKGEGYQVTAVRDLPFGVVIYEVRDLRTGERLGIANGHFFLKKSEDPRKIERGICYGRLCGHRTRFHLVTEYPLAHPTADAKDDYVRRESECCACGRKSVSAIFPNLLADVFSIPSQKKGAQKS